MRPDLNVLKQRELLGELMEPQGEPLGQAGKRVRALAEAREIWTEEDALLTWVSSPGQAALYHVPLRFGDERRRTTGSSNRTLLRIKTFSQLLRSSTQT